MTKLITEYNVNDAVWYAHDDDREETPAVGQGLTPEDACADYYYQIHGDVAELVYDDEHECWLLYQGCYRVEFTTKEAAVEYANRHEWQIEKSWRNAI